MGYPLLNGFAPDSIVIHRDGAHVDKTTFVARVGALRQHLRGAHHVVNACDGPYAFLLGFAAALVNGQLTLLPGDNGRNAVEQLCARHDSVMVLTDRDGERVDGVRVHHVITDDVIAPNMAKELDGLADDQDAVVVYTSGSTGEPQPHVKTWGSLCRRAAAVRHRLRPRLAGISRSVATVAPQHMYGMENAIMLPLQSGLAIHETRPLFPADVCDAIDSATLLITTPIHLRALATVDTNRGAGLVLSSTAPLSTRLSAAVEQRLSAPVMEIYGSTETGVVAIRHTSSTDEWRALDAVTLSSRTNGAIFRDETGVETPLHDRIELRGNGRFILTGRTDDLVKVAGKRASLAGLNRALCALRGVDDAAFLYPDGAGVNTRLVAFVVAPEREVGDIVSALGEQIDSVFLPRPMLKVASLPRNATGKLPREVLQQLYVEMTK